MRKNGENHSDPIYTNPIKNLPNLFDSHCRISGDSRPVILGIVRFAIRDSVLLRWGRSHVGPEWKTDPVQFERGFGKGSFNWGRGSGGVKSTGVSQSVRETSRDESQNVLSTPKLFKTRDLKLPNF